ncbi:MAG: hypothetical protein ABII64_08005 [Elusimicrobiota bacterium]
MKKILFSVFAAVVLFSLFSFLCFAVFAEWPKTPLPVEITTSPEDTEYLRGVMKGALDSILYGRHPVTGFAYPGIPSPYGWTHSECIFNSWLSIAIAGKIGMIPENEALGEVEKTLSYIEKLQTNDGFFWNGYAHAGGIRPKEGDGDWYWNQYVVSDMGFIYCALAVVGEAYPELKPRIDKLLAKVKWGRMYDKKKDGMYGSVLMLPDGTATGKDAIVSIGADCRVGLFMAVASGGVPVSAWDNLKKYYIERYGAKYLKPGEAVGYSEQAWAMTYFLDERGSDFGLSNANMVWGQMCYAQDMGFPVWGWSSCVDPDHKYTYMGFGMPGTNWSVINSHGLGAAVIMYPNQVVKAFRTLEKLGMRKPFVDSKGEHDFGFMDSMDIDTGKVSNDLIVGLDQSILFLSLANYLHDGVVWRYFQKNKSVQNGLRLIKDYANPKLEYLDLYHKRDIEGPLLPASTVVSGKILLIDDFQMDDVNSVGGSIKSQYIDFQVKDGAVTFTFNSDNPGICYFLESLNNVKVSEFNALKLRARSDVPGKINIHLKISGTSGIKDVYIGHDWKDIIIPLRTFLSEKVPLGEMFGPNPPVDRLAMWEVRSTGEELNFYPNTTTTFETTGISFIGLSRKEIDRVAREIGLNSLK